MMTFFARLLIESALLVPLTILFLVVLLMLDTAVHPREEFCKVLYTAFFFINREYKKIPEPKPEDSIYFRLRTIFYERQF